MDKQDVKEMFKVLNYEDVKLIHSMIPEILEDKLINLIKDDSEPTIKKDEVTEFIVHHVEMTNNDLDYVMVKDLYSTYKEYCENNLYIPMNERCFGKRITNELKQKSTVKKINGSVYRIYTGIKFKDVDYKDEE